LTDVEADAGRPPDNDAAPFRSRRRSGPLILVVLRLGVIVILVHRSRQNPQVTKPAAMFPAYRPTHRHLGTLTRGMPFNLVWSHRVISRRQRVSTDTILRCPERWRAGA
jgi:hypothetical protein